MLSPSQEHGYCRGRDAALKLEGKAAHTAMTTFLTYRGIVVTACCPQSGALVLHSFDVCRLGDGNDIIYLAFYECLLSLPPLGEQRRYCVARRRSVTLCVCPPQCRQ